MWKYNLEKEKMKWCDFNEVTSSLVKVGENSERERLDIGWLHINNDWREKEREEGEGEKLYNNPMQTE